MLARNTSRFLSFTRRLASSNYRQLTKHCLHTTSVTTHRKYQHTELALTSKFVPGYKLESEESDQSPIAFVLEQSYKGKSPDDLAEVFNVLSHHCKNTETCISSDEYDEFIKNLVLKLKSLRDDKILKVLDDLKRFPQTPNTYTKNFHELWKELDKECIERSRNWKYPQMLKVCNLWLKLHLCKIGDYTSKAVSKITRRVDRLPKDAFLEVMFYLTICRIKIPLTDVETKFLEVIDTLSINEIGIVCLAFFKTESSIRDAMLIDKIYDRTIESIASIEDITLVNILKTIRYSSEPIHSQRMALLSEVIIPHIHKFNLISCLHVALLGTNMQQLNQTMIETVVKRFNDADLKTTRLKEIERITFMLGLFNFKTKSGIERELLMKIVDELKLRVKEIMAFPKCLSACAYYLTLCGVYDIEIIKSVLKPDFINFAYGELTYFRILKSRLSSPILGKNLMKIGREILSLDSFTRINIPNEYDGPQLTEKMRANIAKFQTHYVPFRGQSYKLTHSDILLLDVKEFLHRQFGPNTLCHVLPHYQRPDIVYCFDENGKSITEEIAECFPPNYRGVILSKEKLIAQKPELADKVNNSKMIAVILGGWNLYLRDTDIPTGGLRQKLEQLEIIGYTPVLIHWNMWLKQTSDAKEQFLENEFKKILAVK